MKKWVIILVAVLSVGGIGAVVSANNNDTSSNTKEVNNSNVEIITVEEAKKIALNYVGKGEVEEVELERKNGSYVYEVEVEWMDDNAEIYIDAYTGEVIYVEDDITNWINSNESNSSSTEKSSNKLITKEEAINIALNEIKDSKVKEVELDEDDGIYVYEIELKQSGKEVELDISAHTGEILTIDWD
ncbi:PepSY domain-containing protein [Sutcliffiella cohnii]